MTQKRIKTLVEMDLYWQHTYLKANAPGTETNYADVVGKVAHAHPHAHCIWVSLYMCTRLMVDEERI